MKNIVVEGKFEEFLNSFTANDLIYIQNQCLLYVSCLSSFDPDYRPYNESLILRSKNLGLTTREILEKWSNTIKKCLGCGHGTLNKQVHNILIRFRAFNILENIKQ